MVKVSTYVILVKVSIYMIFTKGDICHGAHTLVGVSSSVTRRLLLVTRRLLLVTRRLLLVMRLRCLH